MIPSSFKQIVETGRLLQDALLAEAARERQAMRAAAEEEPAELAADRIATNRSAVPAPRWSRLAATFGAFARSLRSAS
jgi:hypothetical protein